jgi:hypothetical protein
VTFTAFSPSVRINAAGQFATSFITSQPGTALYTHTGGTLSLVAREGDPAPGMPGQQKYGVLNTVLLLGDAGRVGFVNLTRVNGSPSESAVYAGVPGSVAIVARSGVQAPGVPAGAVFGGFDFAFNHGAMKPSGTQVVNGAVTGGGTTTSNDEGFWVGSTAANLTLAAREGTQAPGLPAGALYGDFFGVFPANNAAGKLAFRGKLQTTSGGVTADTDGAIWSGQVGAFVPLAREGDQAPGAPAGAVYAGFGDPVLDAAGRTAFQAALKPGAAGLTAERVNGLWSERTAGTVALLVREGTQAPGAPAGATFDRFDRPFVNARGELAFTGKLKTTSGGDTTLTDSGLWVADADGQIALIAREGDPFQVAPGAFRTIKEITLPNFATGGEDGLTTAFGDDQLVFRLTFTDNSSGVFTAAVPEPASLALLPAAAILLQRRRRRPAAGAHS